MNKKTQSFNKPEVTNSNGLKAWKKAFASKDAKAFSDGFAENIVLEASALRGQARGRELVSLRNLRVTDLYVAGK